VNPRLTLRTTRSLNPILLWIAPLVFMALFYFFPLASILRISFERSQTGIIDPFLQVFRSPGIRQVIRFTFLQAGLSTLLTMLVGLPGAYLMARYDFPGKSTIRAISGISFVLPALVVAAAFNALLGPRGWVNTFLMGTFDFSRPPVQFLYSLWAILLAHIFYNTTIVLRLVGDFWSHLDPRLEQAARVLGANRWETLTRVTYPLLAPGIWAAVLLIFLYDFTSFGVILVLGGPRFATLEVEIYNQTIGLFNLPLAASLAVIQLVCTLGITVAYTRMTAKVSQPLSLKPQRFTQKRLTSWRSKLLAGVYLFILLSLLILPLLALLTRSVTIFSPSANEAPQFTLDYYQALSSDQNQGLFYVPPATAIAISLGYALCTVLLTLGIGLPAAWALARNGQSTANKLFDPLLMLPLGTSAVTLGLGFIVALDQPPLDLRASILLVPLAHTLVAFPFAVRSLAPSLRSIRPRLRQASAVLGASPLQVFRHIDLPLVARAVLVAATFAFAISLGEFGATALISRPEYPTVPVMIYRYLSRPGASNYGQAMALSVILSLVTAISILAIERLRIADTGEF